MSTQRAFTQLLLLPALLLPLVGCSEGNPVAPVGSSLTLTANPATIAATGTSTITIIGRKPDGNPLGSGTEISLSTSIGSIDPLVSTDSSGRATATFRGDGRTDTATITATTVAGDAMGTVDVSIQGAVLNLSASPTRIGVNGSSTITVQARRGDGQPLEAGTEIRFTTTLGTVTNTSTTNGDGVARATLRGDGRTGTATITATTVAGDGEGTIDIAVGINAGSVSLQASPASIGEGGGDITLLAVIRDDEGSPLEGANANFTTDIGTLSSGGSIIRSNSGGEATDVLTVTRTQLETITAPTFNVEVQVSGAGSQILRDTFAIRKESSAPIANFEAFVGTGENAVQFDNTTLGARPITWAWDFTSDGTVDSTEESPNHVYGSTGTFTVTLTASNAFGSDTETKTITVPIN